MRRITVAERRARLARRHRVAGSSVAGSIEEAVRSIVALHATDPASVHLSAWARVPGLTHADVVRAIERDRSLVKVMAMRRTLFVVPRELVTTVVRGAGPRVAARAERELVRDVERAGLHTDGADWLRATGAAVMALLADGTPRTLAEARVAVPELAGSTRIGEGRSWQQELAVAPRLLTVLLARGDVVRGPSAGGGGWMSSAPTWVSAARWLGASIPPLDPDTARHDLVRAWLGASAPATDGDLAWWLGDTLTNVRSTLAAIGAIAVELDEGTGWVLPGDEEEVAPVEPWAALLPALDPTTMGWKGRDWYLGAHRSALFDTAGNAGATAWWDGHIVGAWHQLRGPDVEVHLLEDVGVEGRAALDDAAARLTNWLAGDRPGSRWPSPVLTTLDQS